MMLPDCLRLAAVPKGRFSTVRKRPFGTAAKRGPDIIIRSMNEVGTIVVLRRRVLRDSSLPVHLLELHRYPFADALFLHRHAIQHVGDLHRPFAVGDDDELAGVQEFLNDQIEPLVVGFVQSRIHFVENAEGAGLAFENAHQKRDAGHRLFTTGKLADGRRLLARRAGDDFNARIQQVDFLNARCAIGIGLGVFCPEVLFRDTHRLFRRRKVCETSPGNARERC